MRCVDAKHVRSVRGRTPSLTPRKSSAIRYDWATVTKRILLVDCYVDEPGAAQTFGAFVAPDRMHVARATHRRLDENVGEYGAVIISGSAAAIVDPPAWAAPLEDLVRDAAERDVPLLGVCFGHQIIARALYGRDTVRESARAELGWLELDRHGDDPLFEGVERRFRVFCSHLEEVANLPDEVEVLAGSADCAVHAFRIRGSRMWGVQFHAEMTLDEARLLVRDKARKYPDRGIDVDETLSHATDTRDLAQSVIDNFLAQAELG